MVLIFLPLLPVPPGSVSVGPSPSRHGFQRNSPIPDEPKMYRIYE
jgi:hypothetical protein